MTGTSFSGSSEAFRAAMSSDIFAATGSSSWRSTAARSGPTRHQTMTAAIASRGSLKSRSLMVVLPEDGNTKQDVFHMRYSFIRIYLPYAWRMRSDDPVRTPRGASVRSPIPSRGRLRGMSRLWLAMGALSGFVAVAGGAFGAHALKSRISADLVVIFETGCRYQMYHALALLAVGVLTERLPENALNLSGWAFVAGTLLFSGSLYALALTGARAWGAVTPVGGVAFLIGWATLLVAVLRRPAA